MALDVLIFYSKDLSSVSTHQRVSPTTLWRNNLISSTCTRKFILLQLLTVHRDRDLDWPVNKCFICNLTRQSRTGDQYCYHWTKPLTQFFMNKTPKYLNSSTGARSFSSTERGIPPLFKRDPWTCRCWFSSPRLSYFCQASLPIIERKPSNPVKEPHFFPVHSQPYSLSLPQLMITGEYGDVDWPVKR